VAKVQVDKVIWYTGAHHFLENFTPNEGNKTRYGTWNNDWYISTTGEWYETADYTFSNDATASASVPAEDSFVDADEQYVE
jgi:hypothetical protein